MKHDDLRYLVPGAPPPLLAMLDLRRGPLELPIRSEIFGPDRFAQHGRSLAATHRVAVVSSRPVVFMPRLRDNIRMLRESQRCISLHAHSGYPVSPAAEWLLDNTHLIESQLKAIHDGLPRQYFRGLPTLVDQPLKGLPRIYGVAWAFVAHTDGAFDDELLQHFLLAYQGTRELTLGELWALPTTLRVVLVENLRRLAEKLATQKAAREIANLICDRLEHYTTEQLDRVLLRLNPRGAGRTFLLQLAQRLQDHGDTDLSRYHSWLLLRLPDLVAAQVQQPAEQACDNLSVSNAIVSLRSIGDADWLGIVEGASTVMRLLLRSTAFEAERADTRDAALHEIERLARRSGHDEVAVAQALLRRMEGTPEAGERATPGYWLQGPGRGTLSDELGVRDSLWRRWCAVSRRAALPVYLCTICGGTLVTVFALLSRAPSTSLGGAPPGVDHGMWLTLLAAVLLVFPASEAVIAVVNRLISESVKPSRLPRLTLARGIPSEHRVMVVIPGMLSHLAAVDELSHRLELHYLANPEPNAQFALLTDWADADSATQLGDQVLLDAATRHIETLNARHAGAPGASPAPRFIVLHRERTFSPTEQRWIGWERKRGKLEQLIAHLADAGAAGRRSSPFVDLAATSQIERSTRYVLTLDGDTQLPPGRLRDLVGVAAHPHNQPRVDMSTRTVTGGYAILQPRVVTPMPMPRDFTLYHWLFAGQCGIDPYSAASSEVYQDLFAEGTFTGKGLIHVQAMNATLAQRLPEGRVLSHDLLEGALARCATVTDITIIEDAPFHADVAASRVHRWTRGDWQLLPFILRPSHFALRGVNRWKMIDNLRRSMVTPMSLGLIVLALASGVIAPSLALAMVVAALAAGPLIGAVAGFAPSRDDIAKLYFYAQAGTEFWRTLCSSLWLMVQLLAMAMGNVDAVVRALWRMTVSQRHLLEWTTAAEAKAAAATTLGTTIRLHAKVAPVAAALWGLVWLAGSPHTVLAAWLCATWASAPVWIWWVSRPRPTAHGLALSPAERIDLSGTARDTWRLFERCVGPDDNHLPPDNLQCTPYTMVAHRTSPTNIGLYLLSAACAREFGWIGTQDLLERLEATLQTLSALPRHRGHIPNWIDTQNCAPLLPIYISTVDSGNLCGHLLAVAQACQALAKAPYDTRRAREAIDASRARIVPLLKGPAAALPHPALSCLLAKVDPMADAIAGSSAMQHLLDRASDEVAKQLCEDPLAPSNSILHTFCWRAADHIATLRGVLRDALAQRGSDDQSGPTDPTVSRLNSLAARCEALAWEPDFAFLFHRKHQLLHIGFRVADQQLDNSFYDLLASESRLTSLLAIAKGDVPVGHWAALGRPFFAVGTRAGLRSWSGSMFEYLMPSLVLEEPHGSALHDACLAALREQVRFAREHHVPWGISESAYAASDHTLAYQYAPQGVPRLALRRTPPDELVIAPYATVLAVQLAPHLALKNLARIDTLTPRGRYGFVEALDFTSARQSSGHGLTRVDTFMAHHQGMSIVAIANVVLDGAPRRWGMANAHIEAVASLLHERAPREVPVLVTAPPEASDDPKDRRLPGLLREVVPGMSAVSPTHLLANGRYSVALRANGAGWSRWGPAGVTRTRDDALRDVMGSFFYLRWDRQPNVVSLTQRPAPDPSAHYQSTYHADRVCFDASWTEIETHVTVWVSPEDDIEFRTVEIRNVSDRRLDLELMSAFEVTLVDPRSDESHPAFSNLFLRSAWRPQQQALVFERKPRLATETGMHAAHFLAASDPAITAVGIQTSRLAWLGRNRDASQPLAAFADTASLNASGSEWPLDTGLDPVCAISVRLRVAPQSTVRLTFCTTATDNPGTLAAVIDKYRQRGPIERASLMSATLTGIRLRELAVTADSLSAIQVLTTAIVLNLTRRPQASASTTLDNVDVCDRRLLWRFGISGDRPIVLISAGAPQGRGLLRTMVQALSMWSWAGVACDLVVVNAEPQSYVMALQRDLAALREQFVAQTAGQPFASVTGLVLLRTEELTTDELSTLRVLARVHFNADGRPLTHHMQEWSAQHDDALELRHSTSISTLPVTGHEPFGGRAGHTQSGQFRTADGEFRFDVTNDRRPARPWVNVHANPQFGAHISEAGGGYTWALNSRLNQLTPWSNDAIADPPGEWFVLQDTKTRELWSVVPSAWGDGAASYRVTHAPGCSTITHNHAGLEVQASWCVDVQTSVKQIRLRLINRGPRTHRIRVVGIAEWIMGAGRGDRFTTETSLFTQRLPDSNGPDKSAAKPQKLTALMCAQRDRSGGFGGGTAFLSLATAANDTPDWTSDRREFFDARGRVSLPDEFAQRRGAGLDPCAALATVVQIAPGQSTDCVFLLGFGPNPVQARQLATSAATLPAQGRLDLVRQAWDERLGAVTVQTPDPLFDVMVNRWLLYQTLACRLWAKAGFYQVGGAFGFRDQLQDAMALAWTSPALLREQIMTNASRQFPQGDVQHWWHAPTGAGVRTHFSDDLLWLPHACAHYLNTTGDATLLDESVAFLEGAQVPQGAEDAYYVPMQSEVSASVYEHGARAIDHSLRVGQHGLPLMGSGDWNDGMNRVGSAGRGESVWLGWFLCQVVQAYAAIARSRGDVERAQRWDDASQGWRHALETAGWDGHWYRRAYFDDATAMGSSANPECRIDLIAQAWSVISDAAPATRQRESIAALDQQLVDPAAGLIKLLTPPFRHAVPSAGYIQAYPPGVRENGGQYSHAGVWAVIAQARLGDGDAAYRYFTYLSPAHRAAHPDRGIAYEIEPYVMAGDVYSEPPYVGRGGWSWYTGSAAWMHRAAIEHLFGMRQAAAQISFTPCLPSHWPHAELTLRREGRTLRVMFRRDSALDAAAWEGPISSRTLRPGEALDWDSLPSQSCCVMRLEGAVASSDPANELAEDASAL